MMVALRIYKTRGIGCIYVEKCLSKLCGPYCHGLMPELNDREGMILLELWQLSGLCDTALFFFFKSIVSSNLHKCLEASLFLGEISDNFKPKSC